MDPLSRGGPSTHNAVVLGDSEHGMLSDDSERWRMFAEETRILAAQMKSKKSRATDLRLAESYDRLAKLAERRVNLQRQNKSSRTERGPSPTIADGALPRPIN
jgi:hypothetical protein